MFTQNKILHFANSPYECFLRLVQLNNKSSVMETAMLICITKVKKNII